MSKLVRLTVFLAVALTAACGSTSSSSGATGSSSSSESGGAKATKACDLLTLAQAEAVLQDGTLEAKADNTVGPSCTWSKPASTTSIDFNDIVVIIQDPVVFNGVAHQAGKTSSGLTITKASGIGDEAYFETAGQSSATNLLLFRKGNNYIQVSVHNKSFTAAQISDAETTLAQNMISKLS